MNFDEEIRDFLIESSENLANLDSAIVQLEHTPDNMLLVGSIFRTIHTIKGTCGFFGYDVLGAVTHLTENLLDQVREGQRKLTPDLISLVLESVDEVRHLLANVEANGCEGEDRTEPLRLRLEAAHRACDGLPPPAAAHGLPHLVSAEAATPVELTSSTQHELTAAHDPEPGKEHQLTDSTIRVDVGLLNRLMNMVGELVLARNQLLQNAPAQAPAVQKTLQRLNLITSELQEGLMKTRMQPVGVVWNKLPRVVRDLAAKCGKTIQIHMEGAATELDKTIIEAIKDPLTHIVRNSCDHGIETPEVRIGKGKSPSGTLVLRAYHEGGVVNLEISDDGAGLDPVRLKAKAIEKGLIRPNEAAAMDPRDALHLIFMPGFSTAAQVTSISGRGVGMDVVKTNIESIGGTVEVMNRAEGGATIRIQIPLTLAIIPGLVVTLDRFSAQESRFIIPQANLLELVRLEGPVEMKRIENVYNTPVFHHRGKLLPLLYLGEVLRTEGFEPAREVVNIVVLQAERREIGLVVDRICDTQEIVVKPLGRQLKVLPCYVGATIMGDGLPALILDVVGLSHLAGLSLGNRTSASAIDHPQPAPPPPQNQMLLLFRAGVHDRLAVPLALVDRLEEIATQRIELAAGQPVLNYRGEILPLIVLSSILAPGDPQLALQNDISQLIVFSALGRRVGMVVDQILDIVNEPISVRRRATLPGLLGSAVVADRITDFVDLHALIEGLGENWLKHGTTGADGGCLLLLDPAPIAREMIAGFLEMRGFRVIQAADVAEASVKVRQRIIHFVLTAIDLARPDAAALLVSIQRPGEAAPPLVALLDRDAPSTSLSTHPGWHFAAHVVRSDREAIVHLLQQLQPVYRHAEAA